MTKNNSFEKDISWLLDEKYAGKKSISFYWDIFKLKQGVPLAYVINNIPFLGCTIDLSYKPLIPRSETEFWVENAIQEIRKKHTLNESIRILDIYSGSGCIGIALLKNLPQTLVSFGEKYDIFLTQIQKNLTLNSITKDRTDIIQTEDLDSISHIQFDYIFANPPYIAKKREKNVQRSVLSHEPHKALFAIDNGFFHIKKLLNGSYDLLKTDGIIFIEFDTPQKKELETFIPTELYSYEFQKDQFGKWRVLKLTKV
ncbi:MAG: HemK family protein methyltransferase [Candidatus Pacebacteria bacterium]|nr:HemK family protein methyltransferase [Candidatus Paceibacterota bacterium]